MSPSSMPVIVAPVARAMLVEATIVVKAPVLAELAPIAAPSIVPELMSMVETVPKSDHVPVREPPPEKVSVPVP